MTEAEEIIRRRLAGFVIAHRGVERDRIQHPSEMTDSITS